MAINVDEVFETARMTLYQNFDIRTTTLGINLKDCIHSDFKRFCSRVYERVSRSAARLVAEAGKLEVLYGVPIINKRVSVTPVSLIMESHPGPERFMEMARTLDAAAKDSGVDYIGGFGALVQKGATRADSALIEVLPEVLSGTERVCSFLNVGSSVSGINMDAVIALGPMLKKTAESSGNGIGCTKFCVFVNAPEDNPFMAGAFHGVGEPDFSVNIGISGPGVVRDVVAANKDCDLTALSEVIKGIAFKITRAGELVGRELARRLEVPFGIVDISLASTTNSGDSVAGVIEAMGLERVGAHGGRSHGQRQCRWAQRHFYPGQRGRGYDPGRAGGRPRAGKTGSPDLGLLGGHGHVRRAWRHPLRDNQRDHCRRAGNRGDQQQDNGGQDYHCAGCGPRRDHRLRGPAGTGAGDEGQPLLRFPFHTPGRPPAQPGNQPEELRGVKT